ncbi:ComEC/Rec2 family competence protein [Horticoccus sp. 23ND18S-11]|uniref:ComEC/Rec2 family competence protein n=1 Tax=Horticoccus sp. 23ND18S-11 TaxID=3391832 RepID=UPI0039C9D55A
MLPFIAGLIAGKSFGLFPATPPVIVAVLASGVAVFAAWRAPRLWAPALVTAMAGAGLTAYVIQRARLAVWDTLPPREVSLSLTIDRVFVQADARRATGLATVVRVDDHLRELKGQRLYFSLMLRPGEVAPTRSAVVAAIGVIVTLPLSPPPDTFDGYLAGAGMNFRLTRGRVLAQERPAHAYYQFCARAAAQCSGLLGLGIEKKRPALAGLLRAMMLGSVHELSQEQHTLFMQSGTMHLFAISGLNIGVIASALHALLLLARLPPWARLAVGSAILWLFVDITGASPSAVRAFAMAVFLQTAGVLHRPANPLAALTLSALVVLIVAPLQLFSASFLMSYAIVAALIVLGLPLGEAWLERWSPLRDVPKVTWARWQHALDLAWRTTATALAIGLATTLVSLVTGLQFFRLLTPGALFANLILIPAAVVVTLGGFATLLFGLLGGSALAALFNHAAAIVLWAIEGVVRACVHVPGAFLPARFAAPWIGPVTLVVLLVTLMAGYALGWRRARGGWWPPFAVVALVLAIGVTYG